MNTPRSFPLLLVLGGAAALMAACASLSKPSSADTRLAQLTQEFIAGYYDARPIAGVGLGWHQYDGRFVVSDQAALRAEEGRLSRFARLFSKLSASTLLPANQQDLRLLRSAIAGERWRFEQQRAPWRNPMTYASDPDVSVYLKRDFKPLDERIADITAILQRVPANLAAARRNLERVLPKPFIETAIESATGTADFLEKDVAKAAATVTNAAIRAEFEAANGKAVAEFHTYVEWLKADKLPKADDSYALGRNKYIAMLEAEMIDLTPEQILEIGLRELRAEQQRFAAAARVIDPALSPVEIAKLIQRDHPTAASLIPDTRKNLEAIRQFVVEHHIVTVPSEVRARVEETLPPFRATSFASMDTPGPFETKATEAYYYVTPVVPDWTPKQAEEWLSAFNYYTTDIVSVHEAYPGHYVQFLALNASPANTVEKVFSSYAFVEGWAHYCEQMLVEEGFAQPANPSAASREELVKAAKFRVAQSEEALLRLCRLCCSIKLHCQGMTVDEATRFFVDNCYYEEKPSHSEAMRGTFDPGYLYYSLGKLMIYKLRRDWQAQEGANFSLQRFHDEFLRHGMPPIPLLRRIMLKDSANWSDIL
jgi:uncharacterized protein (DUF885 family)